MTIFSFLIILLLLLYMNNYITRRQLRWPGHVSRMPFFDRLPRRMLSHGPPPQDEDAEVPGKDDLWQNDKKSY